MRTRKQNNRFEKIPEDIREKMARRWPKESFTKIRQFEGEDSDSYNSECKSQKGLEKSKPF